MCGRDPQWSPLWQDCSSHVFQMRVTCGCLPLPEGSRKTALPLVLRPTLHQDLCWTRLEQLMGTLLMVTDLADLPEVRDFSLLSWPFGRNNEAWFSSSVQTRKRVNRKGQGCRRLPEPSRVTWHGGADRVYRAASTASGQGWLCVCTPQVVRKHVEVWRPVSTSKKVSCPQQCHLTSLNKRKILQAVA